MRALLLASLASAWLTAFPVAAAIVFDFNPITLSNQGASSGSGLGLTAGSSTISTYMTNALRAQSGNNSASVNVTGALATKTYNGEGFVIGQTLGTSDGGVPHAPPNDTFIINNSFGVGASKTDYFTMVFTNYLVSSISFDYEIFPDANCPSSTDCSSRPDIKVLVGNSESSLTKIWQVYAPNVPGNSSAAPQALGTMTLSFSPVSVIRFSDWPATIGIDNLKLLNNNKAPEPGSLALLGLAAIAGLIASRRRAHG